MVSFNELKIQQIVEDASLSAEDKVLMLRDIESEARGLQRAASESLMNASDGWEADLREVRLALDRLGARKPREDCACL